MEKLYACSLSQDNECEQIMPIVKKSDEEYNELKNQEHKFKHEKMLKEKALIKRVTDIEINNARYEFILAKSIYDNFVDRGLIEDSDEFQTMWYEHIFHGVELDLALFPSEFQTILDFVKGGK